MSFTLKPRQITEGTTKKVRLLDYHHQTLERTVFLGFYKGELVCWEGRLDSKSDRLKVDKKYNIAVHGDSILLERR